MRGKAASEKNPNPSIRITPAHAGKRSRQICNRCESQDHPRTCGEKVGIMAKDKFARGSPPHMRGKVDNSFLSMPVHRITPAHAGKSRYRFRYTVPHKDHPRTCGEKVYDCFAFLRFKGSPPHMRGKVHTLHSVHKIIEDHPRTCGEKGSAVQAVQMS